MSKLISGIDFSKLADFRESVQVKISEGNIVDLPLITLRDAPRAEMFLSRADSIRAEFSILHARAKDRAEAAKGVKEEVEKDPEVALTLTGEQTFDRFEDTVKAIADSQRRMDAVIVRANELADDILEFIAPYLEGTGVVEQLKKVEAVYTTRTLQAMLYGNAIYAQEEEDKQEEGGASTNSNPTG